MPNGRATQARTATIKPRPRLPFKMRMQCSSSMEAVERVSKWDQARSVEANKAWLIWWDRSYLSCSLSSQYSLAANLISIIFFQQAARPRQRGLLCGEYSVPFLSLSLSTERQPSYPVQLPDSSCFGLPINRLPDRKTHAARSFRFSPSLAASRIQVGFPLKLLRSSPRATGGIGQRLGS